MMVTRPRQRRRIAIKRVPVEEKLTGIERRNKVFAGLLAYVNARQGCWSISVCGDHEVILETLPESSVPAELIEVGYDVEEVEPGERILTGAIEERFVRNADGELEPLTDSSTRPIALTVRHAAVTATRRWRITIS